MLDHEVENRIGLIEEIAAHDPKARKGLAALAEHAKGGLIGAARSIADHPAPHICILSGYYQSHAEPPSNETDGPPGVAHMAAGFLEAGIHCRLLTDRPNVGAIKAAARAAGILSDVPIDVATVQPGDMGTPIEEIELLWRKLDTPITHLIAIERGGPAIDGVPRNSRGFDISATNAPLHELYRYGGWTKIGIGDGGNEIGMGNIPREIIAKHVPNGRRIACVVPCDHLIVSGVSNWGAVALLAAISLLRPDLRGALTRTLTREIDQRILEETVFKGPAVSVPDWEVFPPCQVVRVDGLPWEYSANIMDEILDQLRDAPRGLTSTAHHQ